MYMTRRVRFEKRVAGMCEGYELLKGFSPLHESTGRKVSLGMGMSLYLPYRAPCTGRSPRRPLDHDFDMFQLIVYARRRHV